jgi:hypothetical protein
MDRIFYKIQCPSIFRLPEVSFSYFSISKISSRFAYKIVKYVSGIISVVVCSVLSMTNKNVPLMITI